VRRPVCRHVFHHLAFLIKRAHVSSVQLEHGVDHVRTYGTVLRFPSEQFSVELFGAGSVGRCQFDPTETSRRVLHLCLGCCVAHFSSLLYLLIAFKGKGTLSASDKKCQLRLDLIVSYASFHVLQFSKTGGAPRYGRWRDGTSLGD